MAKKNKNLKSGKSEKETFFSKFDLEELLPQKYHPLAVILIIFILFLIFLNPLYFGNKSFQSGDIIASVSQRAYVDNHTDGFTLWDPLIFCGIPAYAIGTSATWFNVIYTIFTSIRNLFSSFFAVEYAMWSFYLIIMGITSFFLMRHFTKNTLLSLFTSVATSFSTGIIVFLYLGHVTKLTSLCMYPLIFLLLLRMKEKIRIIDFLLLIITLQLFIQGFHVQIIFYTLFAVGVYFLYYFFRGLKKKDKQLSNGILKTAGLFTFATIIALLIQADNFTQIYEYSPFSTRGTKGILETTSTNVNSAKAESDFYEYHTNWSFSPEELTTFVIPSFYGFGNSIYQGPLSNNQEVEVNTYFGQMLSVDIPMYMGVIVFFFALFGIFIYWKEPFVRYLTILSAIALLLSFGRNFPILFDLFFYYFPFFDKFRVPVMSLVLVQMSFPVLAGFGLKRIIELREDNNTKLVNIIKNVSFTFSILFVLSLLLNGSISSWFAGRVNEYASSIASSQSQYSKQFTALADYMSSMYSSDVLYAFGFLSIAFWSSYLFIKGKFSRDSMLLVIIILTIIDLWRIDSRGEVYKDVVDQKSLFNTPDYVTAIKNQKDKDPFRILNLKQDGSLGSLSNNANFNAYFQLEDFYGYSGIKPRSYQDIMDVIGPVNQTLWEMLNVKYIVTSQPASFPGFSQILNNSQTFVYENKAALPRMYFINRIQSLPDLDVLKLIKSNGFDPKQVAYVDGAIPNVEVPDSTSFVNIKTYKDEIVTAEVNATGNNFLFFGDTYIAGKADYKIFKVPTGWNAYVDGSKTEIYKVNHGFMGIVVPKGKHLIEFKYEPFTFYFSKYMSLILSSLTVLGLIIVLVFENRKKFTLRKEKSA